MFLLQQKRVKYQKKVPLVTGTEFQVPIPVPYQQQHVCVRPRSYASRCACERLAEQNQARDREYLRALRDRLSVYGQCKRLVRETWETRSVGQSGASMRSIQRHGCVCGLLN